MGISFKFKSKYGWVICCCWNWRELWMRVISSSHHITYLSVCSIQLTRTTNDLCSVELRERERELFLRLLLYPLSEFKSCRLNGQSKYVRCRTHPVDPIPGWINMAMNFHFVLSHLQPFYYIVMFVIVILFQFRIDQNKWLCFLLAETQLNTDIALLVKARVSP